jgi:hypothetical protein
MVRNTKQPEAKDLPFALDFPTIFLPVALDRVVLGRVVTAPAGGAVSVVGVMVALSVSGRMQAIFQTWHNVHVEVTSPFFVNRGQHSTFFAWHLSQGGRGPSVRGYNKSALKQLAATGRLTGSWTLVFLPVALPLDWVELANFCRFPGRKVACTMISDGPVDIYRKSRTYLGFALCVFILLQFIFFIIICGRNKLTCLQFALLFCRDNSLAH